MPFVCRVSGTPATPGSTAASSARAHMASWNTEAPLSWRLVRADPMCACYCRPNPEFALGLKPVGDGWVVDDGWMALGDIPAAARSLHDGKTSSNLMYVWTCVMPACAMRWGHC